MYKTFKCKKCRTALRIKADKDFTKGRCPKCGSWIEIPTKVGAGQGDGRK
ncbi:hypothetical protein [Spirochaeta cellobiosiphila]|nr:hypothetical protein [Spirochaeta cellobiosiphila]